MVQSCLLFALPLELLVSRDGSVSMGSTFVLSL
jgi:hypothetical protein